MGGTARHGHTEIVGRLIENGAKVDLQNSQNESPLFWAARHGHTEIVVRLIENGAKVDLQNSQNESPLFWADQLGYTEIVVRLIDNSRIVNQLIGSITLEGLWGERNSLPKDMMREISYYLTTCDKKKLISASLNPAKIG
ncbi:ankyrin repeat domain-containing protein [unidentified bacterial endosymbiont]|uniref:ankyrin repeat domain-containing protein n=1 Tax=unidentified bacterial endosymbiont TaxID=2355 RepID=UPI0034502EDC